jgi:hypothetical protein
MLEYYKGVLIMTTNRPITFDPAFQSHIHLTRCYDPLDQVGRAAVWKTFLATAIPTATEQDYLNLARPEVNGRRIKNLVKMAQPLALNEKTDLTVGHVQDVFDVAVEGEKAFDPLAQAEALKFLALD